MLRKLPCVFTNNNKDQSEWRLGHKQFLPSGSGGLWTCQLRFIFSMSIMMDDGLINQLIKSNQ